MREYSETVPIQYEEGITDFMGFEIMVDERVLIPRPETELLVNIVSEICENMELAAPVILDVGTGSGIIPLGLKKLMPACRVTGCDISSGALGVAFKNIAINGHPEIELVLSDMFSYFGPEFENYFDCIVSNPPYVSSKDYDGLDAWVKAEPRIALYAGSEGMDHLAKIISSSGRFLKKGGVCAVEIGYDQAEKVKRCFGENGFIDIKSHRDINGYERVITGKNNG
jgi:release factor glutamine methyltransferase